MDYDEELHSAWVDAARNRAVRWRKKPVIVEAVQWFKQGDHPNVKPYNTPHFGWIDTLEGGHIVTSGDWIITGVHGEHYPCKPDIFEKTYERVEE